MKAQDQLNQTAERLIEKIEQCGTKWITPFNASFPQNYKTNTTYNGLNILNLWMEAEDRGYTTNYWLTFNQVKDLKGQVKKGERSTPIFFFKPIKKLIEDEETGEREEKTIPILKMYYVFNISVISHPKKTFNTAMVHVMLDGEKTRRVTCQKYPQRALTI